MEYELLTNLKEEEKKVYGTYLKNDSLTKKDFLCKKRKIWEVKVVKNHMLKDVLSESFC
jgi:hypothetical protein